MMDLWRRRYWRLDEARLARFAGLRPMVVVTGGSEGIGLAIAEQFARAGDAVLLVSRNAEKLATAAAGIKLIGTSVVEIYSTDITQRAAADGISSRLAELNSYCDVLVNSAGMGVAGDFSSLDADGLDRLVALNVGALTRLTRCFLPEMLTRGQGGILNVASLAGYAPGPYQAAYYASKAYVLSLTEAIADECAGKGVRIAALAPGPVDTAFHERMLAYAKAGYSATPPTGSSRERATDKVWALYLWLMPVASSQSVAKSVVWQFRLGVRVIVPGLHNRLAMLAMRGLPHRLVVPIVGWLLRPRGRLDQ